MSPRFTVVPVSLHSVQMVTDGQSSVLPGWLQVVVALAAVAGFLLGLYNAIRSTTEPQRARRAVHRAEMRELLLPIRADLSSLLISSRDDRVRIAKRLGSVAAPVLRWDEEVTAPPIVNWRRDDRTRGLVFGLPGSLQIVGLSLQTWLMRNEALVEAEGPAFTHAKAYVIAKELEAESRKDADRQINRTVTLIDALLARLSKLDRWG